MIYATDTMFPQTIRTNFTLYAFGVSTNLMETTIRIEGLENALKSIVFRNLFNTISSKQFFERIFQVPENYFDILKVINENVMLSEI